MFIRSSSSERHILALRLKEVYFTCAGLLARAQAWVYGKLGWPANSGEAAKAARQTVRQEYNAKNAKLNEARRRKSDVEGKLAGSYGPSDEFLPLVDQYARSSLSAIFFGILMTSSRFHIFQIVLPL